MAVGMLQGRIPGVMRTRFGPMLEMVTSRTGVICLPGFHEVRETRTGQTSDSTGLLDRLL